MKTSEVVDKWEKTYLLEGLSHYKKVACALALDEMAQILINNKPILNEAYGTKEADNICGVLLPLVSRLVRENLELMPSMTALYEHYINNVASDPQAALVKYYVEDVKKHFNKK